VLWPVLPATILRPLPTALDNGAEAVVSSTAMETYTSGAWTVKAGEEDAFVEAWRDFVTWGSTFPGSGMFRLVRDLERPNSYLSFAPWDSFEAQQAWKDDPEFPERIMRVRSHCDDFQPSLFELVTQVE
jgi:heme-degrading monooxygenase HmoA